MEIHWEGRGARREAVGEGRVSREEGRLLSPNAPTGNLLVEAWELRYLARLAPPDRWVLDLAGKGGALVLPIGYSDVALSEDRLFIPREYVELFRAAG